MNLFMITYMNKNDDDNELLLKNDWLVKGFKSYFKSGPQSEILTIANLTYHEQDLNLCRTSVQPVLKKILEINISGSETFK